MTIDLLAVDGSLNVLGRGGVDAIADQRGWIYATAPGYVEIVTSGTMVAVVVILSELMKIQINVPVPTDVVVGYRMTLPFLGDGKILSMDITTGGMVLDPLEVDYLL